MLKVNILTLFPQFFDSTLQVGIFGRAIQSQLLKIHFVNPRDFTKDVHQSVDDCPFGGEDGMVMKYEPLEKAIQSLGSSSLIYLSPQGQKWDYKKARAWAKKTKPITFLCGRYSGVDQRFLNEYVEEEISIGDYVLSGGEPAVLLILDSMLRFLEGALGNEKSADNESFEYQQLLEAPLWTRPREILHYQIPKVVLSGHHEKIRRFRYLLSILVTAMKRPDLLGPEPKSHLKEAIEMAQNLSQSELRACGLKPEDLQSLTRFLS